MRCTPQSCVVRSTRAPQFWDVAPTGTRQSSILVPTGISVVSLGGLALLGYRGWPGEMGVTAINFCEAARLGIVQQPANTWSNLAFVAVGLLIGLHAARHRTTTLQRHSANPMLTTVFYPTFYASISTLVGLGSMAMHASTTEWGGDLDVFAMYLWAGWLVAYALTRLLRLDKGGFLVIYTALVSVASLHLFTDLFWISNRILFGSLIASGVLLELMLLLLRPERSASRHCLWSALVVFVVASLTWCLSHTHSPLCNPASFMQPHALWHVLSAWSVGMLYCGYCRYEISLFQHIADPKALMHTEPASALA